MKNSKIFKRIISKFGFAAAMCLYFKTNWVNARVWNNLDRIHYSVDEVSRSSSGRSIRCTLPWQFSLSALTLTQATNRHFRKFSRNRVSVFTQSFSVCLEPLAYRYLIYFSRIASHLTKSVQSNYLLEKIYVLQMSKKWNWIEFENKIELTFGIV